ncbi:uncharacterized protein BJ212DRAFT_1301676 [Suillus subaureus]|uniref:Uncharacterized protein n=1 Tax=Suillus subaureus TaxID=48587 RepID=A0A9P7E5W9_9AGAM|nr:uncharacterized protein BJ212DRAFT_1301676 [Suillus subaureus]KAG1812155.1 hypothetical protein BJ212DRAFT_1301676 [Suillus subaureus]
MAPRPPPTREPQQPAFLRLSTFLRLSPRANAVPVRHIHPRDPLDVPATLPLPSSLSDQVPARFDRFEISLPPRSNGVVQSLRQHLSFLVPRHSHGPPVVEVAPGRKRLLAAKLLEYKKVDDTRHPSSQQAQENDTADTDSLPDVHWVKAFLCYYSCWSHGRLRIPPRWHLERVDIPRQDGTNVDLVKTLIVHHHGLYSAVVQINLLFFTSNLVHTICVKFDSTTPNHEIVVHGFEQEDSLTLSPFSSNIRTLKYCLGYSFGQPDHRPSTNFTFRSAFVTLHPTSLLKLAYAFPTNVHHSLIQPVVLLAGTADSRELFIDSLAQWQAFFNSIRWLSDKGKQKKEEMKEESRPVYDELEDDEEEANVLDLVVPPLGYTKPIRSQN